MKSHIFFIQAFRPTREEFWRAKGMNFKKIMNGKVKFYKIKLLKKLSFNRINVFRPRYVNIKI